MKSIRVYEGGIPHKLMEFFKANPTEELALEDIVTKFGGSRRRAHKIVERLTKAGVLEHVRVLRVKGKR